MSSDTPLTPQRSAVGSKDPTTPSSDLKRAFVEDGERKTHVGGQALLEGIMMRGKYNWVVAVREPDGNIYMEEHDLISGKDAHRWMSWPFVRGCTALVESLALGFKALEIAGEHAFTDDEDPKEAKRLEKNEREANGFVEKLEEGFDTPGEVVKAYEIEPTAEDGTCEVKAVGRVDGSSEGPTACQHEAPPSKEGERTEPSSLGKGVMTVSMIMGVVLGVALFIVVPAALTNLIVGEYDSNTILWNVVDGILRVAVFIFYIWLIGRMEDIRRMFMYHGAEHKTIHCYEHNLPLTPENARSFPRLHVRCGTAFLIMVLILAIIVYTIVPVNAVIDAFGIPDGLPKLLLVIAVRIIFLPVIAGISYEITVKWAGSHPDNPLVKVILWPGMQMQYLTTNEPDEEQIECAIAAMKRVLEREEREAAKAASAPLSTA